MRPRARLLLVGAALVAGCAGNPSGPSWTFAPNPPPPSAIAAAKVVEVYRSPSCSCCHEWEAYMQSHGWTVRSMPTDDMSAVKARHGLPQETWSCHTAVIDGYIVEGHVPIEAIEDLLATRPAIDGIALPAMPDGSPGMPGDKTGSFEILALADGEISTFGSY